MSTDEKTPSPAAGAADGDAPGDPDRRPKIAKFADDKVDEGVIAALARLIPTGWPSGTPPVNSQDLFASARRHAVRAFRARANDDHQDAALQFGVMLEHLAKSHLVGFHPTLVLEKNFDLPTLLRLAGQGQLVKPGHVLKTIGLRVALERIGEMQAGGTPGAGKKYADQFELVLQARDGIAHVGAHGGPADEVAQLAIRGASEILRLMDRSFEEFFADWATPARALLDEHATKVHRIVQLRLSRARDAFAQRFAGLTDQERRAELAALDVHPSTAHDDSKSAIACPACEQPGVLSGTNDIWFEADYDVADGDEYISGVSTTVVLIPDGFSCPVCGLRLQGSEQLVEAALDETVELREAFEEDVEAYYTDLQASSRVHESEAD